ncbi:MAG: dimethylsulfonioproprionate lyase family protein [Roseovarius sp.]
MTKGKAGDMNTSSGTAEATRALRRLLRASALAFARHDPALSRALMAALPRLGTVACLPSGALAPPELGPPEAGESALDCLRAAAPRLAWRRPGFGQLPEAISGAILVTEILGPDGMVPHDTLRFGALHQQAGHDYPEHNHRAEEIYHVLAGTALWSMGGGAPEPRGAGDFIHHPPSVMHAMHTRAEPMLALWVWRGDIGARSYRLR